METTARCPASCGELIQGWIGGSEKLISCPVNWYSEVTVSQHNKSRFERPNMRQALLKTLAYFDIDATLANELNLHLNSTIPIAKGMASSTADIVATIVATARWVKEPISTQAISDICISIEPSDSSFFTELTLYDHLKGQSHQPIGLPPDIDILVLEPDSTLTTAYYRRKPHQSKLKKSAPFLKQALQKITVGCQQQSPELIGEAATISAVENQAILPKPGFNTLLALLDKSDLYGINVAHSGTVIGILLDANRYDPDKISAQLTYCGLSELYPHQHWLKLIASGYE